MDRLQISLAVGCDNQLNYACLHKIQCMYVRMYIRTYCPPPLQLWKGIACLLETAAAPWPLSAPAVAESTPATSEEPET